MENKREFHTFRGYQIIQENKKLLSSSMEDYLEMIFRYCTKENYIRINELAKLLNVNASSASKMVQKLANINLLKYEKYGIITMTKDGVEIGRFLLDRHNIIEKFLSHFGKDKDIFVETELIEHHISFDTLESFDMFNKFLEKNIHIKKEFDNFKKNNDHS